MKVVLVNHSDTRGGAAVVTMRLMTALRNAGVDARMLVVHKASDSPYVDVLRPSIRQKIAFLYERACIYVHNGFSRERLFKVSIANAGMNVHSHPWVKEADVVCLNWINQGVVSLKEIGRIQAPVVWTMHDMWCMTGICHHAGECTEYSRYCRDCPLLGSGASRHDLSYSGQKRKRSLYRHKKIYFVGVSSWVVRKSQSSALLVGRDVSMIHNAFPIESYHTEPRKPRGEYGLPEGKRLIIMGAARLDDPIKGLDLAVEALNMVNASDVAAVFFGDMRDPHALDSLRMPHISLGSLTDPDTIADIYAHCDVVLSSSHYETLPGTLIEGMAAGCVPVSFDHGGQADIIDHRRTGYLACHPDAADLAAGISFALGCRVDRRALRAEVGRRFSAQTIAARYISLFERVLGASL